MNKCTWIRIFTVLVAAFLIFVGQRSIAQEDIPLLFSTDSEKEVEIGIFKYFKNKKKWNVSFRVFGTNPDDIYLRIISKEQKDTPKLIIEIDTLPSRKLNGKIVERVIIIKGLPDLRLNKKKRPQLLEFLNEFQSNFWIPPKVYLGKDGNLALSWPINIAGKDVPVHAEQVADAVSRMAAAWVNIFAKLQRQDLIK